jgi:hypothetical protein
MSMAGGSAMKLRGRVMAHRWLLVGCVAFTVTAAPIARAPAQPAAGAQAERAIHSAIALSDRIRLYHRWRGTSPLPPGYCATLRAGEAALQELARLANRAISYRLIGLAQRLERVADRLSDALDEEEMINLQAGFTYVEYPCPAPSSPYPARMNVLDAIDRTAPACSRQADIELLSFNARRVFMGDCLRLL